MKKRLLSLVMSLSLCLSLLPREAAAAGTDAAADTAPTANGHSHCVCGAVHREIGAEDTGGSPHKTEEIKDFQPWSSQTSLPDPPAEYQAYYLTADVTLSASWTPAKGTVLCLNGHSITANGDFDVITVGGGSRFTLTDCRTGDAQGRVTHGSGTGRGVIVGGGDAVFDMYGGVITGNTVTGSGGGVYTSESNRSNFYMYGGAITGNTATENGGGIGTGNGNTRVYGGVISGNQARQGGGLYTNYGSGGTALFGGTITGNTATESGGGIYANDNLTLSGVSVTGNTATESGGGVYVSAELTVAGAVTVTGNRAAGAVNNVYLAAASGSRANAQIKNSTLTAGARIGLSAGAAVPVVVGDGWSDAQKGYLFSDDERYLLTVTGTALQLVVDPHTHCLCGSAAHQTVGDHDQDTSGEGFSPWTGAELPTAAGRYYLVRDYALSAAWTIPAGVEIAVCLNGHTITASGDFAAVSVEAGAALHLTDCKDAGKIARAAGTGRGVETAGSFSLFGGSVTGHGGGVHVADGGSFGQYGGSVSGNGAPALGGGVHVADGGSFGLHGGSVSGNSAASGGGVYISGTGAMSAGAAVTGNTATESGGGIYVAAGGSLTVSGGDVTGNTANVSGGGIYAGGGMTVSGKVRIGDNQTGGAAHNVYLPDGKRVTIAGLLAYESAIGVTAETAPTADSPVVIAEANLDSWRVSNAPVFSSDGGKHPLDIQGRTVRLLAHSHQWEYALKDGTRDTITARCIGTVGTCSLPGGDGGSLQLLPPADAPYDGRPRPAALQETDWRAETPAITYAKQGDGAFTGTPTAAGTYTASITLGGVTASAEYRIDARPVTLTGGITARNRTYAPGNTAVTLEKGVLTFTNLADGEDLDVTIPASGTADTPDAGTGKPVTYSGVTLKDGTAGRAADYVLTGDLPEVTVDIAKAAAPTLPPVQVQLSVSAGGGEKDLGQAGMPADAKIQAYRKGAAPTGSRPDLLDTWSVESGTGAVRFTLKPGGTAGDTLTLPVTITSANYEDAAAQVQITLTGKQVQAPLTLTGGDTVTYGETLTLGVSGGSGSGAVTYTVTDGTGRAVLEGGVLRPTRAGTVTVTAAKAEDADFTAAFSDPVSITILPRETGFTVTVKSKRHDGTAAAEASVSFTNLVPGETLTRGADYTVTAEFDSAAVGAGKAVAGTVTLLASEKAGNYRLQPADGAFRTTADITAAPAPPAAEEDTPSFAFPFGDVSPGDWYYTAVRWAAEKRITLGVTSTRFAPHATATQGQVITFLWRKAGSPAPRRKESPFSDVYPEDFYYDAILWAAENGITGGDGDGTFRPYAPCTGAQALTLMYRASGAPQAETGFTDVTDEDFYAMAAAWAAENGLASVVEGSRFSPTQDCTRAQIISLFYQAYR